jgi:hypothetical protein
MEKVCCSQCGAVFAMPYVTLNFNYKENNGLTRQDGEPAGPSFDCPVCKNEDVDLEEID